jgi:hypothetical protein
MQSFLSERAIATLPRLNCSHSGNAAQSASVDKDHLYAMRKDVAVIFKARCISKTWIWIGLGSLRVPEAHVRLQSFRLCDLSGIGG